MAVESINYHNYSINIENAKITILFNAYNTEIKSSLWDNFHTHMNIEIFSCFSGEAVIETENGPLNLHTGDIAIIPPDFMHYLSFPKNCTNCKCIAILITKRNCKHHFDLFKKLSNLISYRKATLIPGHPLSEIIAELPDKRKDDAYLETLNIALLLAEISDKLGDYKNEEKETSEYDIGSLLSLEYIIENDFMHNITVKEVADRLFMSERQLARIIKKRYNTSLHQILIDRQITAAEKLLMQTEIPITSVAQKVGFGSVSGFYRAFHKKHELTPAEYRQQFKK